MSGLEQPLADALSARALSEQECIDLSRSETFDGWHSPVTVSVSVGGDRQMITYAHASPCTANEMIADPPLTWAVMVNLSDKLEAAFIAPRCPQQQLLPSNRDHRPTIRRLRPLLSRAGLRRCGVRLLP